MTMPLQPPVPVQGPPAPPGMGNQPDPRGGFTAPVSGMPPPGGGQLDPDVQAAQEVLDQAQVGIDRAQQRYEELYQAYQQAQTAAADPANVNASDQLRAAQAAFDTAQKDLANANTAAANAGARMVSAATAAASRAKDPDLKNYYAAHAAQAQSQVELTKLQGQALQATTPAQVASLQAQAQKTLADAQATGLITPAQVSQIGAQTAQVAAQTAQVAALTPYITQKAKAEATTATAQAGVAPQAAQAAVDKAQADVEAARASAEEIRRRVSNMPSEQQSTAAINLGLQTAEADLAAKQQALEQARQLLPIAVNQAQANVGQTQANTAATQAQAQATTAQVQQRQLGPLYGVGDQITKLREMIKSGQIQPQDADTALNSYLNSQLRGATPFQQAQESNQYAVQNRQLDMQQTNARLQAGAGFAGQTLGMFGQLAAGAGPGFGAQMAAGFQAALEMGRQFFGNMGGLQNTPAAPDAAKQAPTVHINIGSGQPVSAGPDVQPALPPTPPTLAMTPNNMPSIAANVPALPGVPQQESTPNWFDDWQKRQQQDVADQQIQAGIPMFAQGGVVTHPTLAVVGERGPEAIVPLGSRFFAMAHPAVQQAAAAIPGGANATEGAVSPWAQHLARWQGELATGKVVHPGSGR